MDSPLHAGENLHQTQLLKPKSRLLTFRDRLLSPHLKEYRPHAAESLHQRQVLLFWCGRKTLKACLAYHENESQSYGSLAAEWDHAYLLTYLRSVMCHLIVDADKCALL